MRTALPHRVSRASEPGSRGTPRLPGRWTWLGFFVALAVLAAAAGLYLTRSAPGAADARYGGQPSWLPTATVPVGRVVQASPAHPKLAVQGDTVRVVLPGSQVMATAVGPVVPEEGGFPVPAVTKAAFTVTLTGVSGTVPLRAVNFAFLDEHSQLHYPKVTGAGGHPAPATVSAGQTVTLILKAVLPTGGGELRWSPEGGTAKPVVSWDFDVEID